MGSEATEASRHGDSTLVHQPTGLYLTNSRQRFKSAEHLQPSDRVFAVGEFHHLAEGDLATFQLDFDCRSAIANFSCFGESLCALFGTEFWWRRHA